MKVFGIVGTLEEEKGASGWERAQDGFLGSWRYYFLNKMLIMWLFVL